MESSEHFLCHQQVMECTCTTPTKVSSHFINVTNKWRYFCTEPRHPVLLSFSIIENGRKIFKTSSTGDQLTCIHGIKALSMMWVMYGHEYSSTLLYSGVDNYKTVLEFADQKENMYILSAQLSVDSFFAIGGLLLVYVYLKSLEQGKEFNLVIYYLHRFIR